MVLATEFFGKMTINSYLLLEGRTNEAFAPDSSVVIHPWIQGSVLSSYLVYMDLCVWDKQVDVQIYYKDTEYKCVFDIFSCIKVSALRSWCLKQEDYLCTFPIYLSVSLIYFSK